MNKWLLVSQLGVAATGALVFLSLVADSLQFAEAGLDARKEDWDREQKKKKEEELEAMAIQAVQRTTAPRAASTIPEIPPVE